MGIVNTLCKHYYFFGISGIMLMWLRNNHLVERRMDMLAVILTILLFGSVLKLTGFFLKLFGKLIGVAFGLIGYIIVGVLAVTVLGLATVIAPILIGIGIVAIVMLVIGAAKKAC